MTNIKRNLALIASSAVIASVGIGGVMTAHAADKPSSPADTSVNDTKDDAEANEVDDGPNQGPDVNPNEPGHQDADESGEADEADGSEEADDGPNRGPDADPNEPGHQDADESGEAK